MRGSIVERVRRCGKPRCVCADDPAARHPGLYLSVHLDGRTQVVHLRPADVPAVREAIAGYEALWATVTALTAVEVAELAPRGPGTPGGDDDGAWRADTTLPPNVGVGGLHPVELLFERPVRVVADQDVMPSPRHFLPAHRERLHGVTFSRSS
jgi:hypothetical protein